MQLDIHRELIRELMKKKGWKKTDFARRLGLNYSYFYRLLKGERNPGSKFFSGFMKVCKEESLLFEDFVYIKSNYNAREG